jgi:hypothetical protein
MTALLDALENYFETSEDTNEYEVKYDGFPALEIAPGVNARREEEYGGEGNGDEFWLVVKLWFTEAPNHPEYYRMDGYYSSYEGGELDGEWFEVIPVPVQKIEWRKA